MSKDNRLERALQRLENIRGPDRTHYVRRLRVALDKLYANSEIDSELEDRIWLEVQRLERRAQSVSQQIEELTNRLKYRQFSQIGDDDD